MGKSAYVVKVIDKEGNLTVFGNEKQIFNPTDAEIFDLARYWGFKTEIDAIEAPQSYILNGNAISVRVSKVPIW